RAGRDPGARRHRLHLGDAAELPAQARLGARASVRRRRLARVLDQRADRGSARMTASAPEGVAIESRDGVLHLTLDRPAHKNTLHPAAIRGVVAALEAAATDDALRVVHLTGRGSDFCSGADWVASNA